MTDTVQQPAPPEAAPVPADRITSTHLMPTRIRFRPVLERLENRDVPSVGWMPYGEVVFTPSDPIPTATPVLASEISFGAMNRNAGVAHTRPTPSVDLCDTIGSFHTGAMRLAIEPGERLTLSNLDGQPRFAMFTSSDALLGSAASDGLFLATGTDAAGGVMTAGTNNVLVIAGLTGSAILLAIALRQHQGRPDGGATTVARPPSRRTREAPVQEPEEVADDETAWPALTALLRERADPPPGEVAIPEPGSGTNTDTIGDLTAQKSPNEAPPEADPPPSRPGEVCEEGCPYVARLLEFAAGRIATDSEEGLWIGGHRDCPRCRRWLDFFAREASASDAAQ